MPCLSRAAPVEYSAAGTQELAPGSTGTVTRVTEGPLAQIEVRWDCGRSLSLVPGVDRFEVIGKE